MVEVSLPWKDPHLIPPDNYQLSSHRLQALLRCLRQNEEILTEYHTIIKSQIQKGNVEKIERPEVQTERIHHHHAVIRRDKETTKLLIVYNASAKATGLSLNNCLYAGPKFDQKMFDLLLRFRFHRVTDIEKAFLMVSVVKGDRAVFVG